MDIIAGGGKYGCHAVEFLRKRGKCFTVVDVNPDCLAVKQFGLSASSPMASEGEHFVRGDLKTVLDLLERLKPEFLFPTAPVHIAADLVKIKFNLKPWAERISPILHRLPQSVVLQAGKGKLVVSFNRDGECVEECPMPQVCPSSGTRKPCKMTELMRYAAPEAFMLISYSMAPGMGALKGSELRDFFEWAKNRERFVVGTACDCHGVFSAFQKVGSKVGYSGKH